MKARCIQLLYVFLYLAMIGACGEESEVLTGNVMGKITDSATGEVLQGVTVTLTPGGTSRTTGADGTFEFLELSPKQYEIQARKAGYVTNHKTVNVVAGRDVASDIQLTLEEKDSKLVLSVSSLNFGESNSSLSFDIINEGKSRFNWNISGLDKIDWLEVNPASGTLDAGKSNAVQVNLLRENITEYKETTITVNADNESVALKITAEPKNENARIALSTNTLDFGTEYTSLTFDVMNVGDAGDIEWNITGIDVDWVKVAPLTGTTSMDKSSAVKVELDREKLPEGKQTTTILVKAYGESFSVTISAEKEIKVAKIALSKTTLDFGADLTSLTFDIDNVGNAGDIDWTITGVDVDWVKVSPVNGTTSMDKSSVVTVEVDREKMDEGKQTTTIQVKAYGELFPIIIHAEKNTTRYIKVNPTIISLGTGETGSFTIISYNGSTSYELLTEGESSWAKLSKANGVIPEYSETDEHSVEVVTITADRTGLTNGEYKFILIIRTDLGDTRIPVSMIVGRSEVGNLLGTITDTQTGEALENVLVTINPLGKSCQTDFNGHYEFLDLESQEYTVTVSKAEYNTDTKKIFVETNKDNHLNFTLSPSQPKLEVNQRTLDFGYESATLTLDIKNTGLATLAWKISEDITWLSCSPTVGTLDSGKSQSVVVNVDRKGLSVGDYSQIITVTSDGGNVEILVNMSVQDMSVSVSPRELDFGAVTSTMQLTMNGGNNVSYTLTPSDDWILPSKTSGVFSKTENIVVAVDRANHAEGKYEGRLLLKVGEHSKDIPVRMVILAKELPSVTLLSVDDVTGASATFKGAVISVGSSRVTKYGFCWGRQENPELSMAESCNLGDCSAAADMNYMTDQLEANTTYYVRAYAENSEGISYSNQLRFTTGETAQKPEVETGEADNIYSLQVDIAGKILKIGDEKGVIQHGHVWSRTANPTLDNQKTQLGSTTITGSFVSTLTGLEPNTTYHVRAYATNSIGTSYGADLTFTTIPDVVILTTTAAYDIVHNAATVGGSISDDGGNVIIERGICWSTEQNPTINNERKASQENTNRFSVRLEGLNELTAYHARAYVITKDNKVHYGYDITFSTTHEIHLPKAGVTTVDNIGVTFATFHSSVVSDGGGNVVDCGFCYSRIPNPTVNDTKVSCGKQMGTFLATVKDLTENTTYYVRSYVTNEVGTAYGEVINLTTLEILLPTLSAVTVKTVTHQSATLVAEVVSDGNGSVSECGFVYSTSPNPGLTNNKVVCGTSHSLSGRAESLLPNTTYYVRAYATNEKGTGFSKEISFTTEKEKSEDEGITKDDFGEDDNLDDDIKSS